MLCVFRFLRGLTIRPQSPGGLDEVGGGGNGGGMIPARDTNSV